MIGSFSSLFGSLGPYLAAIILVFEKYNGWHNFYSIFLAPRRALPTGSPVLVSSWIAEIS
jgi:hypothetical protein